MNKLNKRAVFIASAFVISAVAITVAVKTYFDDKNTVSAQSITTIADYEKGNISTYLGHGYNIVNKGYINSADVQRNYIFNIQEKNGKKGIRDTEIIVDSGSNMVETYDVSSEKSTTFIKKCLNKLSGGIGINTNWCGFTQLKPSADFEYDTTNTKNTKHEYIKHVRQIETSYVSWLLGEDEYYDYLTESFKRDVMKMEPVKLFKKYGTHVLTSVALGGKIELTYQMHSSNTDALSKAEAQIKMDISGIFGSNAPVVVPTATPTTATPTATNAVTNAPTTDPATQSPTPTTTETPKEPQKNTPANNQNNDMANVSYVHNNEKQTIIENVNTTIHTSCYGGDASDMSTLEKMKAQYPNWLRQVANAPALVGILDEGSLYPIWDLINCIADNDESIDKASAKERINELKDAFEEYGLENYKSIVDDVKTNDKIETEEVDIDAIAVKPNTYFDKTKKEPDKIQALHDGYDLGKILLINAQKNEKNNKSDKDTYKCTDEGFKVRFRLDQDKFKLPVGSTNAKNHRIVYNTSSFGIVSGYGNVFGIKPVMGLGKGCYFVQVTYNDLKTETVKGTNFLSDMNKNDTITLLDSNDLSVLEHGGIKKINVGVVYQTLAQYRVLNSLQDWIAEKEIEFTK